MQREEKVETSCVMRGLTLPVFAALLCLAGFFPGGGGPSEAYAEKEDFYTSSEEFLPVGAQPGKNGEGIDMSFLEDERYIHHAVIEGIKLLREENSLLFLLQDGGKCF